MKPTRQGVLATVTAIVLVALGIGVGVAVSDVLGIRTEPSPQMQSAAATVPDVAAPVRSPEFTIIDAPDTVRLGVALDELRDVTELRETEGEASLTVTIADSTGATDDAYRLEGTDAALTITATSEDGAVRAVYDLASQVRAARSVTEQVGDVAASALSFRMTDLGAVGVTPEPAAWATGTDYSHASRAFADVILPEAPYIDETELAKAYDEFDEFVRHSLANGFTALSFPGFVEFVTFDDVPGGPVYAEGDEHREKAIALREAFSPFWERADELGVDVFLRTDMLALTTPLEQFLVDEFGSLDTENAAFWDAYGVGLDELYAAEPAINGVLVRIGEAGQVYDVEGWDVYSSLAVTTVDAVRAMLTSFTAQAERAGREVIFRTWSVGVGDVGDMHTNVESYEAVLEGINSPALIVSTKYTLGDFYTWLPVNNTLEQGEHRRIVEFESRREFEAYGAFPNDLGAEYQWALQELLAANELIEGVWVWTQDWGPYRSGPMTLYLKTGFWQLYELNTQLAAALAIDLSTDVAEVTADWAREWFSDDPETVESIVRAMTYSREAIAQGLYIEQFADKRGFALGLEPPPMMWIFEWDILTGDTAVLSVLYSVARDSTDGDIDLAIAGGLEAVDAVEEMRAAIADTDAATWRDPEMHEAFIDTLDYELDVLRMLAAYRAMFLHQAEWHDTLSTDAYASWDADRELFESLASAHLERYEGDINYPAYNVTAAQDGVQRAERDLAMSWMARALLAIAALWVIAGIVAALRQSSRVGLAAARATWTASVRPWHAGKATRDLGRIDRWLVLGVPAVLLVLTRAVQTSFLSWVHLAVVLGSWLIFVLVTRWLLGRWSPWPVIAAVGGVVVVRCIVTLFAVSFSGPGGYWFAFWTEPGMRSFYIAIAFALFAWVFIAAGWALSGQVGGRRATGFVLAAIGAALAAPAVVVAVIGLEPALSLWNDQMGLLPWGLARILGLTTYLEIPSDTAWWAAAFGAGLLAIGLALSIRRRAIS